ncbi:MAG: DUF2065 domain-containing protein [Alphaproteobacteria bacterium]
MNDFLTAATLALILEGILYAIAPGPMKRAIERLLSVPNEPLRLYGLLVATTGVGLLWLMRRHG